MIKLYQIMLVWQDVLLTLKQCNLRNIKSRKHLLLRMLLLSVVVLVVWKQLEY